MSKHWDGFLSYCMSKRYYWLHCNAWSTSQTWNKSLCPSSHNSKKMAAWATMAVYSQAKWNVYWWPWTCRCCWILEGVCSEVEGIWKVFCHIWKWWEIFVTTNRISVLQIGCLCLILVTHDESTFYETNHQKKKWVHALDKPEPVKKGDGQSIMVSTFVTSEWGLLWDETEWASSNKKFQQTNFSEACLFFWAGKAQDGYFDNDDLVIEVDKAIDIFEGKTNGFATGPFLFDNAPSALSAWKMPKGPHAT